MFADRQTISSARVLRDSGEMIAPVTIARAGDMLYKAKELGEQFKDLPPETVVRVNTPASVLFDAATIELCRSMPVTIGHPSDNVNLKNNKELQKGFVEGLPEQDGSHLSGFVVLNDEDAIKLVDSGVDQTSWGHDAVLERVEKDGVVSAIKTKITSVNHLAIVRRGRASTTRIGDSGEEIDIVDKSLYDTVEAERDAANSKVSVLEQRLADAESSRLTDEEIQSKVQERFDFLASVAKLSKGNFNLEDYSGKSVDQIKRDVVQSLSDSDLSSKSDAYISARFDVALEDSETVTLSDALSSSIKDAAKPVVKEPSIREQALARRAERDKSL